MVDNTAGIVGIECLAAAQGIELQRPLEELPAGGGRVRRHSPEGRVPETDRYLAPDIEAMRQWALKAQLPAALLDILPSHS